MPGFEVTLAEPIRSGVLLELRFAGTVFVDATRFDAFIGATNADALMRQRIEPGDADAAILSSTNAVRLPVGHRPFRPGRRYHRPYALSTLIAPHSAARSKRHTSPGRHTDSTRWVESFLLNSACSAETVTAFPAARNRASWWT